MGRAGEVKPGNWKRWLPCRQHLQKLPYDRYADRIGENGDQRCNFNAIAIIRKWFWKYVLKWRDQGRTQEKYPIREGEWITTISEVKESQDEACKEQEQQHCQSERKQLVDFVDDGREKSSQTAQYPQYPRFARKSNAWHWCRDS
jgi:hypothetical protein